MDFLIYLDDKLFLVDDSLMISGAAYQKASYKNEAKHFSIVSVTEKVSVI